MFRRPSPVSYAFRAVAGIFWRVQENSFFCWVKAAKLYFMWYLSKIYAPESGTCPQCPPPGSATVVKILYYKYKLFIFISYRIASTTKNWLRLKFLIMANFKPLHWCPTIVFRQKNSRTVISRKNHQFQPESCIQLYGLHLIVIAFGDTE